MWEEKTEIHEEEEAGKVFCSCKLSTLFCTSAHADVVSTDYSKYCPTS